MANIVAATTGVLVNLLSTVTTGTSAVIAIPAKFWNHTFFITGSSGISAGKVQIETSSLVNYSGTWFPIGSEQTLVASTQLVVTVAEVFLFFRARVTTDVVGGTVSVDYLGYPN